jgi:hypothetical protein
MAGLRIDPIKILEAFQRFVEINGIFSMYKTTASLPTKYAAIAIEEYAEAMYE